VPVTVDHRLIASHNDAVPTTLELDDAEKAALIALLKQTIAVDPFPLSLRSRTFNATLAKLQSTSSRPERILQRNGQKNRVRLWRRRSADCMSRYAGGIWPHD
jgi:hypothetical protein